MRRMLPASTIGAAAAVLLLAAPAAFAGYADAVLNDSPVSYWRLNENSGATTADDEQKNFDGTYTNGANPNAAGPRPADGFAGFDSGNGAVTLDGSDDYVATDLGSGSPGVGSDYPFTLEVWFKTTDTDGENLLFLSDESAARDFYGVNIKDDDGDNAGNARAIVRDGNTVARASGKDGLNDNNWHYMAGVFDDPTAGDGQFRLSIYTDPTDTSPDATQTHSISFINGVDATNIGTLIRNSDSVTGPFAGLADEVAVYDTALSGTQIKSHFDAALIPEPASLTLLAPVGLLTLRRRRSRARTPKTSNEIVGDSPERDKP